MTLHFHPTPKAPKVKADTRALKATRARCHKQLQDELAEEAMSRELVNKHTAHRRDSQQFRQTGEGGCGG